MFELRDLSAQLHAFGYNSDQSRVELVKAFTAFIHCRFDGDGLNITIVVYHAISPFCLSR
jgi:hypothetical protein